MAKLRPQIGFNPQLEREAIDERDWFFGVGEELTGVADSLGIIGVALFAWPRPIDGIYPRVGNTYNHAVIAVEKGLDNLYPVGETQFGNEDFLDCASRSPVNNFEMQFTYALKNKLLSPDNIKWLKDKGYVVDDRVLFSDRFIAVLSGTTRQGNSLKSPQDFIRTKGLIPKSMLPKDPSMTWNEYHDKTKITQAMLDLGQEFLSRFTLNYEKVVYADFPKVLKSNLYDIYDNYIDSVDGDYVKRLAPDYDVMSYGYRNTINEVKKNNDMQIAIEVKKRKGTPDYLVQDKKTGRFHRIGDEKTFNALVGSFTLPIEEIEIDEDQIEEPLYLGSSFLKVLVEFFSKLKGR